MRLASLSSWLFGVLLMAVSPAQADSSAEEVYEQGYESFRNGQFKSAINFFKKALSRMDADSTDYVQVHYNLGRCVEGILEKRSDPPLACQGTAWFEIYLERAGRGADLRTRDRARAGLANLKGVCQSAQGQEFNAEPNELLIGERTRVLPWGLTVLSVALISGGGFALSQYSSFIDEREASRVAFEASTGDERERHRVDVRRHELRASAYGAGGWSLVGTGVVVGVTAVLAWLDVDAPKVNYTARETTVSYAWQW